MGEEFKVSGPLSSSCSSLVHFSGAGEALRASSAVGDPGQGVGCQLPLSEERRLCHCVLKEASL